MAFIINFQSPVELEDLEDRFLRDGLTNIDHILHFEKTAKTWTVDKEANVGDAIYFMCAKTSADHMGHVLAEAKRHGSPELVEYAERERELYRQYAGNIVAVGAVGSEPFASDDSGYTHSYWRSPWYAQVCDFKLLRVPVSIDLYREFITVSRTGSITRLDESQDRRLWGLVCAANPDVALGC